jgi:hypothetical protein
MELTLREGCWTKCATLTTTTKMSSYTEVKAKKRREKKTKECDWLGEGGGGEMTQ